MQTRLIHYLHCAFYDVVDRDDPMHFTYFTQLYTEINSFYNFRFHLCNLNRAPFIPLVQIRTGTLPSHNKTMMLSAAVALLLYFSQFYLIHCIFSLHNVNKVNKMMLHNVVESCTKRKDTIVKRAAILLHTGCKVMQSSKDDAELNWINKCTNGKSEPRQSS